MQELKNQMSWILWILDRDSIIHICFLFFYQGFISSDSSHSMTDESDKYRDWIFSYLIHCDMEDNFTLKAGVKF